MTDVGKAIRSALATARHIAAPLTRARGGAAQSQNAAPVPAAPRPSKPNENEDEPMFDYSRLHETPKVPQTDLPRYDPARGAPDRVKDLVKNKKVRHKMLETIQHGLEKGGANWYNTDPLRDEFIKHLGAREGDAAHRQYLEFVAATSPRSEVGANVRNASYYYHRHRLGHPMPKVGDANPQPYGHMAQRLHQMNAQRVTTEGWDTLNNPKPASFVENLAGNQKPVTVDTHAFRLPAIHAQDPRFLETAYSAGKDAPKQNIQQLVERGETKIKKVLPAHWQAMPKTNEYGAMEQFYQGLAKELGITPAQAQAAAWVGGGKLTGLASDESKPFLRFLQDRVYKTARETGMDPKDVLKDFITGKVPLRADGGAVQKALDSTAGGEHDTGNGTSGGTGQGGIGQEEGIGRLRQRSAEIGDAFEPLFGPGAAIPQSYARRSGSLGLHGVAATHEPTPEARRVMAGAGLAMPTFHELNAGPDSARAFHGAISAAKQSHPAGAAVHVYEPHEYEGMRHFVTPDRKAGFALKGNDIVSLFNTFRGPHKNAADAMLHLALQQGGRKLDAFDTVLPHIYGRNRFKAVARMPWNDEYRPEGWKEERFHAFNKGRPDVVHMAFDPDHRHAYDSSHGALTHDYDEAVGAQDREVATTEEKLKHRQKRADGGPVTDPAAPQTPAMWQNPNFQKWFNGSKVVNGQGQPDTLYHGTAGDFDVFKQKRNDIGMHFGTIEQANDRLSYQRDRGVKPLDGMNLMPVHLAIRNPLRMEDLGSWDGNGLAWALGKEFPADDKWISLNVRTPSQARRFLQSSGYDGIVYKNTGEVGGSEPYRAAIRKAATELHKHFPKSQNAFDHTDQRHPAYQAWSSAHDRYREHRENNAEDSYIAFEPHQIKSAIGNAGTFNPKNPSVVKADGGPVIGGGAQPQSDPASPPVAGSLAPPLQKKPSIAPPVAQPRHFNGAGMYSHAVEQALALPQVRGAPHQMLASMKGVKQEELANANPAQAFAGKSHVTREELAHHFRTAMPRIHESEFSDDNDPGDDEGEPQVTQYGEYTIPGGKNYRELLLHLPPTPVPPQTPELYRALQAQHDTGEAVRQHMLANGIHRTPRHGDQQFVPNEGKNDPEYQRLQEVAANAQRAYHAAQQAHVAKAKDQDFKSSHWSTPNVLAHLRMSDRQIPTNEPYFRWRNPVSRYVSKDFPTQEAAEEGAKKYPPNMRAGLKLEHGDSGRFENALHLEELQSDWGQEGREKGFRDGRPWFQHVNIHSGQKGLPFSSKEEADAAFDKYPEYLKNELKLEQHGGEDPNKVPHGPYVTSTNGWVDLGLKRALLEAARAGHDRLVWTPGAEQAKRYGLSNHVDELSYHPGAQSLTGYKGGKEAVNETVPPEKLPDYIGREAAQKLLSAGQTPAGFHRLAGQDLDVGGEGHKYFYDKLIPGRLKDILKKLGHEAQFDQVRVTHKPKNPTSLDTAMGDLLRGNNRDVAQDMRTTLHSLKLPPDLRDKIKKGLPAFAKGGAVKSGGAASSRDYPLAPRSEWCGDANYEGTGGSLSWMPPARYLAQVRPLKIDETSRDNIDSLKDHIQSGRTLDPLAIYANGMEDGRHRAHAARELNIAKVPVLTWPQKHAALTQKPTRAYAAGGGVRYDTQQDGPFYRVARKNLGRQPGVSGADAPEVRGPSEAPVGGGAGPVGDGGEESPAARRLAQLQQIANSHAHSFGHGPVADAGNSESSLHKQSAIGRAFQLAATEHPGYKRVVFDAYRRRHPDLVRQSGARNYDELRHAAYSKLGHEVRRQFDRLPLKLSYHHGAGDYADSKSMRHDVLNNGHLAVFRGGDRHDFLHRVDPRTRLNENEMFRAVHDAYGRALHGSTFGPQGEEKAWNAHRQMFSPLAALAMSAETRGQNSFVNYTPVNAQLLADKHEIEAEIARARKFKDRETEQEALERKKKTMAGWKYAPQKAVLLPPEMNDPKYAGGMPDYLTHLIKPEPGTGLSSPITHFSHSPDVKELDPSLYGTGIPGDERARVMKRPGGVKERAYGYLGTPDQVKPEPGLGAHAYQGHVNDVYDLSTDPLRIAQLATEANRTSPLGNFNPNVVNTAQAQNDMERMAKEHGYSGVANPKAAYPMAALFDKVPVSPRGPQPYAAGGNVVDRALAATRGWSKS